jgi:gas vesicle protein
MASSQKDFMVGCLLGGLIGASAALLMPKKFLNGINGVSHKLAKSTHHKADEAHASVRRYAVKKSKPRKAAKHAAKKDEKE